MEGWGEAMMLKEREDETGMRCGVDFIVVLAWNGAFYTQELDFFPLVTVGVLSRW